MFDMLKSLTSAVVKVAVTPVTVAADIITMGGALTDEAQPYTTKMLGSALDDVMSITKDK